MCPPGWETGDWSHDPDEDPYFLDPSIPRRRITSAEIPEIADAVLRGCAIRDCIIEDLGELVDAIRDDPRARLAHIDDDAILQGLFRKRDEHDDRPIPQRDRVDEQPTHLHLRGCVVERCDLSDLDMRCTLEARFSGNARFHSARFAGDASFFSARFSGNARFHSARFAGDASFFSARFGGVARFGSARFAGDAWFFSARFDGVARFDSARFSGVARFDSARFDGLAWFGSARFAGDAGFGSARFAEDASFTHAVVSAQLSFQGATVERRLVLKDRFELGHKARVSFRDIVVRAGATVEIDEELLGRRETWRQYLRRLAGRHPRWARTEVWFWKTARSARVAARRYVSLDENRLRHVCARSHRSTLAWTSEYVDAVLQVRAPVRVVARLTAWFDRTLFNGTLLDRISQIADNLDALTWLGIGRRGTFIQGEDMEPTGDDDDPVAGAAEDYYLLRDTFRSQPSTDKHEDLCTWRHHDLDRMATRKANPWSIIYLVRCLCSWLLMRNMLGYLLKLHRILITGVCLILVTTVIYWFGAGPGTIAHNGPPATIDVIDGTRIPYPIQLTPEESAMWRWHHADLAPLYFSLTTFVTLGYGDFAPLGWFKLVTGLEATFGVALLALFTVAWGRRMVR